MKLDTLKTDFSPQHQNYCNFKHDTFCPYQILEGLPNGYSTSIIQQRDSHFQKADIFAIELISASSKGKYFLKELPMKKNHSIIDPTSYIIKLNQCIQSEVLSKH